MIGKEFTQIVSVPVDNVNLEGELTVPSNSRSLVIFSHGSGSNRLSKRNGFIAEELQKRNISTLLFDLLTEEEHEFYPNRFDIDLLSSRLVAVTKFMLGQQFCEKFKVGYFGASTGAASALLAAAAIPAVVKAVVSRGGRPDLAADVTTHINAPTLLIVGELDDVVLPFNKHFHEFLMCEKQLEIIPGATHLFEEEGALNRVSELTTEWFAKFL